jgi:hypothetical protein
MKALRVGAIVVALTAPAAAHAQALDGPALSKVTDAAMGYWHAQEIKLGWTGLSPLIVDCYRALGPKTTQAKAAWCIALDYYTRRDISAFPVSLTPPYFSETVVAKRSAQAVAASTPPAGRDAFMAVLSAAMNRSVGTFAASHPKDIWTLH